MELQVLHCNYQKLSFKPFYTDTCNSLSQAKDYLQYHSLLTSTALDVLDCQICYCTSAVLSTTVTVLVK